MLVVGCRSVLTLFWNASSRFTVVRIFLRNRVAIWPSELSLRTSSCGACLDHGVYCGVSWPCLPQRKNSYGPLTVRELDVDALAQGVASPVYVLGLARKLAVFGACETI